MSFANRLDYYKRTFSAYLMPVESHLTFWHQAPQAEPHATFDRLGPYYMRFAGKADYSGEHDTCGIPLLNYRGKFGLQYNPIAIAQWGLGNYNAFCGDHDPSRRQKFLAACDWLCATLETNALGVPVWQHHFDWEYRERLKSPWYSGLAQGQGISLLVRAHAETGDPAYLDAAQRAFASFLKPTNEGGVAFIDSDGNTWIEEYIVSPPTHILNGFIWAAWGLHDFFLATGSTAARELWERTIVTLGSNLARYDLGFWSLYEQSGTRLPMVASPFYHQLHIVQLRIMHQLTGRAMFAHYAELWQGYAASRANRTRALLYKAAFKLCYY